MPAAERTVVVVPTYDERENLPRIVAAIFEAQPDVDLLVVDDASPDGTGKLADALAAADRRVTVLHRAGKQGLGRAYLHAFAHVLAAPAGYTHIVQIDADLSHDPRAIATLRQACRDGADLALGSRWIPGGGAPDWPLRRRLLSRGGSRYASIVLGADIRDLTGGFKCWTRRALEALPLGDVVAAGYAFQIEMTVRALRLGCNVVELPITFTDRTLGASKMSGAIVREAVLGVWRLRGLPRRARP
ncbi:MAG: polyprenol monophosphomannose synthase [Deltaproteobacteria bacterium]|nr:polyprenol monophosphomannose synthase [Nannocystaceae bacterium]